MCRKGHQCKKNIQFPIRLIKIITLQNLNHLKFNELSIANKCIQIYFSLPMIANQFLPRAYLCQFELLAPRGTHQLV
jgi:hypothetical protein